MAVAKKKVKKIRSTREVKDYGKLNTEEFCKELKKWQQDPAFISRVDKFIKNCLE